MIATQTLIDRIDTALTTASLTATISDSLDFTAVDADSLRTTPMLWISLAREDAESNTLNHGVSQRVAVTFSLIIAAADSAALDPIRAVLQTTLVNWEPTGAMEPLQYNGGAIADLYADLIWWEDHFTTAYLLRNLT